MSGNKSGTPPWEEVEHTADWALRVRGDDLRSLFENAARGMVSLIGGEGNPDQPVTHHQIALSASDQETLLVDWLTELLYLIEDQQIVLADIQVQQVDGSSLAAQVGGRPGGQMQKHIKAVTYHNLSIRRAGQDYETTIVFDV